MKTASGASLTIKDVFQLIAEDLERVEAELKTGSRSALPLINDINHYLHSSGGKRLRPALLLITSRMCKADTAAAVSLGVVVELIHVATLVHDDIIDNARFRRGRPSVNARWGNQVTVLMGDWLYMTSFDVALRRRNFSVLDTLTHVTRRMVEGELLQYEQNGKLDVSAEAHLEVCRRKTADLFSACTRIGGILGNVDPEREEQLAVYGHSLGMAFQLIDDLLDFTSSENVLGKPVLKDLEEGKITLPLIYLLEKAGSADVRFLKSAVERQDFSPETKERIIAMVREYKTLEDLLALATRYANEARASLECFPDSLYREALLKVPEFVVNRSK